MRIFWLLFATLMLSLPAAAPAAPGQSAKVEQPKAHSQWLAVLTLKRPELYDPSAWTEADNRIVSEHFAYLKRLTSEGVIILAGRTTDTDAAGRMNPDGMGIIIFEAPDRQAAESIIAGDPAVKAGLFNTRLHEYRVALSR